MKKVVLVCCLTVLVLCWYGTCYAQDKWGNLLIESARVFEDMTQMPEDGIPESLIEKSYAIAIFPSTIGGGFVFGGKYGQGVIVAKDQSTGEWSPPAVFNLGGISWGLQIGGQATDIILLVMSERGLDGLFRSKFKLGGDASVAAGPVGRDAEASTDLQLKGGILSYSRSRGAFAGIKLEGAMLSLNREATESLYNGSFTAKDILIDKKVEQPAYSERLIKDLSKH